MAANDNIIFKTSTDKTIDNLLQADWVTANTTSFTANGKTYPGTELSSGTVYFTSDGHIVYDLDASHRLWMGRNVQNAINAQNADKVNKNLVIKIKSGSTEGTSKYTFDGSASKTLDIKQGSGISLTAAADSLTIANAATDTLTGTPDAGKTITAFDQVNGAVAVTFSDISITKSQVSDFPTAVSAFTNDVGYLTSYTETDPTVPAWAKASTKPSYSWTEITDKPSTFTPASHTHGNITNAGELSTASRAVVTDANKKITVADLTVSSVTAETTTATTFVYSVTQNAQGKITVKTRPLPTYNNYSLPAATSTALGGIKIGYSESGKNYAVQLDNNNKAYVNVPWTDTKVTQTAQTEDNDYKILTTTSESPSSGTAAGAGYGANLTYNPHDNKLKTGNLDLTGALDVIGNATFHSQTAADSLTVGSLLVNGNANFVQSPTAPTPASGDSSTKLATTEFVKTSVAGLSGAMHFRGTTTSAIVDGSTTNPIVIDSSNYTAAAGDVVLREITSGNIFEYVWTGSAWEMLGRDDNFKVAQTAVDTGSAATNKWVSRIQQNTNGDITATMGTLDTSGTWSGKAVKDGSGNNIVNTYLTKAAGVTAVSWDSTNKKLTRTINGTAADVLQFVAGSNITLTAESGKLTITNNAVDTLTGSPAASKTITAFDQTNGGVKATFADIAIAGSQVTSGTVAFARLPDIYWANVKVSDTSSTTTTPTFGATTISGGLTVSSLTASQAVSTDANKKLVSTNLTVSDSTADNGIQYVYKVTQSAVGKITVTKSTIRSASTSQTGVVQLTDSTSSTSTTTAATPNSVKSAYDLANNHKYWANVESTSAAAYNKEPEVKSLTIGNGTTASGTKKVQLVYDATAEVLNFVFT